LVGGITGSTTNGGQSTGSDGWPVPSDATAAAIGATGGPGGTSGGIQDSPAGSTPGDTRTWGPLAGALSALGLSGIPFAGLSLGASAVTATGVVGAAMAFGLFGKRRRDGDPSGPDEELAAAASMGLGARPLPSPVPEFQEAEDPEAQLPRWRRPSLLLARKADLHPHQLISTPPFLM
jgi:hypothetical protein